MFKKLIHLTCLALVLCTAGVASAELVGYWKFDESGGTAAADSSGYGNHGTLNGVPQWVTGKLGGALDFDGSTDYVEIPHNPSLSITDAITIAAWTNMRANASGEMAIVSKGGWAANDLPYELTETPGDVIFWQFYDDAGRDTCSPSSPPVSEWHHITATYDGKIFKCYIDGVLGEEWAYVGKMPQNTASVTIGRRSRGGTFFNGMIDDVAIFNHALSAEEIPNIMMGVGGFGPASGPNPPDGAIYADTWVTLSWKPGDFAVSHDVYLGDKFDDVNNGTGGTFRGNQTSTFYVAGFPGYAYPDGLVPGTTYYWRIDEVNTADPNSPWRGPVWRFTVPPRTAYNPSPADGAKFIDAAATTLSWTAGFGAKLHTVYFGDNHDTVANATGRPPQGPTTYNPGPLKSETTYYWRVDEFDGTTTYKGGVWSFSTAKAGGGVKGQYYRGMNFESLALTRTDPQINFNWGANAPDPAVGVDSFSVRWTGEVEAVFTETYTFYPRADDGVRLWVDGIRLVDAWVDQGATEYSGTIDLVAGNTYNVVMEMYENGGDAVAELRWSSPRTPKQLIPQAALSLPLHAGRPSPANGTVGVKLESTLLTWSPGDLAASHDVYFGTDAQAVKNAAKASPEYKGSKTLGNESYDPGKLAWNTTYYWRIDEVNNANAGSPWKGNLWSFSTGDFLLVDDFETYNDIDPPNPASNRIFDKWIDGFATPTTNGALVGNDFPPYAEQTVVHGGAQSMPYSYDNNLKTSEATITLVYPRNWTAEGVTKLSLWFRGDSANAAEKMYVALNSGTPVYHADPKATQTATWTEWVIDLQAFQGATLANVNTITIGFGTKGSPAAGGSGKMYFDDIRLYR